MVAAVWSTIDAIHTQTVHGYSLLLSNPTKVCYLLDTRRAPVDTLSHPTFKEFWVFPVHKIGKVSSIIKNHIEWLPIWPVEGLFNVLNVLLVHLSLPGVDSYPSFGHGCSSMILRGEDVTRAPLDLGVT